MFPTEQVVILEPNSNVLHRWQMYENEAGEFFARINREFVAVSSLSVLRYEKATPGRPIE